MASTPRSSLKATISTASPTTSSVNSSEQSSDSATQIHQEAHQRAPSLDEDNDSGDEWGVEIGNLIIDLDADVEKDEMKEKNGARNSNNNNSIKGSNNTANPTNSQSPLLSNESIVNPGAKLESSSKGGKFGSSTSGSGNKLSQQSAGKIKSKSKKSIKSATMSKHTSALAQNMASPTTGRIDFPLRSDDPIASASGGRSAKPEVASSKTNRSYKKHGKNNNHDKKNDAATAKEGRDKPAKDDSKASKHHNQGYVASTSSSYSVGNAAFTAPSVVGSSPAGTNKSKRGNSPCFPSTVSNVTNHHSSTPIDTATVTNPVNGALYDKTITSHANEAPVLGAVARLGKHRKTSSLPAPMKYQKPFGMHNLMSASQAMSNAPSTLAGPGMCNMEPSADQNIVGKRERISSNAAVLQAGSKKIKLEKERKLYASGMTPNDGISIEKPNARSPANLSLRGHFVNVKSEYKMTVGQGNLSSSSEAKGDKKSNSAREASSSMSSNMQHASQGSIVVKEPGGQGSTNFPQNHILTPCDQNEPTTRTIGTVTSYADVGVSTEPESLGPCEPGTSVHLSGIVWHETESGVLVVNVTWRNRSYVGTLLDATKHDWAPPRIPDVDSDTEYRVKSGRPKRQRGANGNGSDGSRKGRKSAMMNGLDEYKCSPSSNKRRNAKMSELEACSGNDGEICTTPSKSAKRARMSRTAAAKSAAQKTVNVTVGKESSGDGTSGSGSSACSSPIFMECPYANCKKRYKDDSAFKYHESHAHQGEEMEEVEKSRQEEESPVTDSPKDSDNGSTKSVEEMPLSDSSGSSTVAENDQSPKESNNNNYQTPMEINSQVASAQAPFVVTQSRAAPTEQYTSPNPMSMQSSYTNNVRNNDEVRTTIDQPTKTLTEIVNSSPATRPEETSIGGAVSPYTLTDSQSNDSISLKTRVQTKPTPESYHSSRPTPSRPSTTESNEHAAAAAAAAALEASSAVDSESAQAVQTLLQLQENSQDQLPGLTSYGQTSRAPAMSMPSQIDTTTTPGPIVASSQSHSFHPSPSDPADKLVTGAHSKSQTAPHTLTPPFRNHSKDGTPLPRMSVGVCSPRSQVGGQYVVGGYSHGTVASNSSQEKAAHHTSTGLKTVKGITVPIPTGTQEVLAPSSQSSGINPTPGSAAGNTKKQKRKKPKGDAGKSPNEPSPKPAVASQSTARPSLKDDGPKPGHTIPDQTRIKQEHQHQIQSAEKQQWSHHRMQHEPQLHGAKHPIVKSELDMKSSPAPQLPRGQGHAHRNPPHPHRQKIYSQQDQASRGQGTSQTAPGNRNNNTKMKSHGASIQPQQRGANSPIFPDGQNKGDSQMSCDGRPRQVHSSQASHGASHSLSGRRSLAPVDSSAQQRYRLNVPHARDSTTPTNPASAQGRPSSMESSSPPPPVDSRRLSSEGNADIKRSPSSGQRTGFPPHAVAQFYSAGLFNPYVVPCDLAYHAQLLNGPKFQQHFERVIQNEIQKDQKLKEEPSEGPLSRSSSRQRSTPSPNQQKHPRSKSPSRTENRVTAREPSPRVQPYTSQHNQQLPPNSRQTLVHASRESPVPHGSYLPTTNKLSTGAPAPASRGLSPRPRATPPQMSSSRPPRPSSETERHHRREPSTGERPQAGSRTLGTSNRKPVMEEGYPEHRSRSPDKSKLGPPTTVYASPGLPVQITPGARGPVQYYTAPYQHALIDPRVSPYAFSTYAMFPTSPHIFPGHWPPSAPPHTMTGGQEKAPSQSPHSMKPSHERSSIVSRSPYRDESERRQRADVRGRDGDSFSKERRTADGPPQQNIKSVTPDPKASSSRNQPGDGNSGTVTPPMQRHLHTHHHIHEGFPSLIPTHPQYPYPMAPAVMAGSETAAPLAQYPKRDLP